MNIASLAAVASATAASALGENVTLLKGKELVWEGPAVVSPDAAVDSSTGTPIIANTAYALITHAAWKTGGGNAGGPSASGLKLTQEDGTRWAVRAVLADGGWWRLQMVKVLR